MTAQFYIAACADTPEGGIYRYEMRESAAPEQLGFTPLTGCNYLAKSPDGKYMFGTAVLNGEGAVASFKVEADGSLTLINTWASGGKANCYVITDPSGKFLYCANYLTGNVGEFRLEEGKIVERTQLVQHKGSGPNKARQDGPHTHFVNFTPEGKYLIVIDLGIDSVVTYPVDPENGLDASKAKRLKVTPGNGPRHLVFDKSGKLAYLANELGNSVTALRYQGEGEFEMLATVSTLPALWQGDSKVAAIRLSTDERFLFASNRGFDSVAVYELDGKGGMKPYDMVLTGGSSPRDINFLPGGKMFGACNEFSNIVFFFDYNGDGKLTPNGCTIQLPRPLHIFY